MATTAALPALLPTAPREGVVPVAERGGRQVSSREAPWTPCTGALGALRCVGDEGHDYGCVFQSTSGVPDRHTASSGE